MTTYLYTSHNERNSDGDLYIRTNMAAIAGAQFLVFNYGAIL